MSKEFNNKPLVSIIMNCYNGESYLSESIESLLSQSYKNWELIFWDNQSKDKSSEILKSYKDERIKYFYANEHTSLYKARNLAIEKSKGDFIAFLDTDDLWDRTKLEMQMPYFQNYEVGVVFSNLWILKKNIKKRALYSKKKLPRGFIYEELIDNYQVGIITTIIRKKFYSELKKKFDDRFSIIGDYDLFLRLSKICIFESVQKPLASYRLHGKNLSILQKKREVEESEVWLKENKHHLKDLHFKNLEKNLNYRKFVNHKMDGEHKKYLEMFKNSKISIFNIKNLAILFTPTILLKKLLWWHQD